MPSPSAVQAAMGALLRVVGSTFGAPAVIRLRAYAPEGSALAGAARAWLHTALPPEGLRVALAAAADKPLMHALASASIARSPQPVSGVAEMMGRAQRRDTRIYVAYHQATGARPLAWTEAVLRDAVPRTATDVLQPAQPGNVCAFYSLAIVDDAVGGLGVAKSLIHRAAATCASDDAATTFVTFSPIPAYRAAGGVDDHASMLRYLTTRRCAVGRFHMSNGAVFRDVLPNADVSEGRMRESFGAVAVYEYRHVAR